MTSKRTLRHFGLTAKGTYRSPLTQMYETEIEAAIEERHMLAVVGEYGSGKTTLANGVLRRLAADPISSLDLIEVVDPDREKVGISNVLNAAIYHYGENPRREREARAIQFIKLVGKATVSQKRRVVFLIEDAHRLHHSTFRALKDLRERSFLAVSPLFTVLLVGQGGLAERIKRFPEVFLRTNVVELDEDGGWMTHAERVSYLAAVYGDAIEPSTRERVALMARTPLALDHLVEERMREAMQAGFSILDENVFPLSLRELKDLTGASVREIEQASGVPHSTVNDALNQGDEHPRAQEVRDGLQQLARDTTARSKAA